MRSSGRSVPTRVEGFRAARWLAGVDPQPTAAISYNDSIALGLFYGLAKEGLFPGKNFALIGHEDVEESSLVSPSLSVTRVSRKEMGQASRGNADRADRQS